MWHSNVTFAVRPVIIMTLDWCKTEAPSPSFFILTLALLTSTLLPLGETTTPNFGETSSSATELFAEPESRGPAFTIEPPNRIDFLNDHGVEIVCQAEGYPTPRIHWVGGDNIRISNIDNFRTILSNSSLLIHPFKPSSYRQDVHSINIRCVAKNEVGSIRSRDVQIRAVIAQQWSVKVVSSPPFHSFQPGAGPILFRCEVDLLGGGRDFIQVTGWKLNDKYVSKRFSSFYEESEEDELEQWHWLPNGDLVLELINAEDNQSKLMCMTKHKITGEESTSSLFTLVLSEKPSHVRAGEAGDGFNIGESFPAPIVVRVGDPIVLHCYGFYSPAPKSDASSSSSSIRWEKLSGSSWVELPLGLKGSFGSLSFRSLRQIGGSLVAEKSSKMVGGHYRCILGSKGKVGEFEVRVLEPLSVNLTINQAKPALDSATELTCKIISSSYNPPSVVWLKDTNLINPGGRFRYYSTNILQINPVQQEDRGIYQCIVKTTEIDSAQDSVRLELADAPPRLIYGFIEQTLSPGPSISFRCGFAGYPTPQITWFLDNWPITLSYDTRILVGNVSSHGHLITYLNISETRVEDGGLYTCNARNRAGQISHSARLNIYGPSWIRVVPPLVAISGEFFIMNCPISGYPINFSSIVWEKDGLRLPLNPRQRVGANNGSLTITSLDKTEDSGAYFCSLGRVIRREIQLNVVAPLRISPFPEKGSVVEGERLTLVCSLGSGDPPVRIQWKMQINNNPATDQLMRANNKRSNKELRLLHLLSQDGGKEEGGGGSSPLFTVLNTDPFTSLLSIAKVRLLHTGRYICSAKSTSSGREAVMAVRTHDLTVLVPIKIEPMKFMESLKEGMRTRLVCGVSQGDLPIQFTWFLNGKKLEDVQEGINNIEISALDSFSTILRFSSLSLSHMGMYTCLAKGPYTYASFSAKLIVQVAPKWIIEPENLNISRGREAQFDCSGFGVPEPKVNWLKATGDVGVDGKWRAIESIWPSSSAQQPILLSNGSLIFPNVEELHESDYMCQITNPIQTITKIVHLSVQVQPYFVGSESTTVSLTQGKTHEISCEAISSSPIYLTWSKDTLTSKDVFVNVPGNRIHTIVVMEGRRTKSTLVIEDSRSSDTGYYKCTASNFLGKKTRTYRLTVEEQPGPPLNLRIGESAEATRAWLEWDPPISSKGQLPREPPSSSAPQPKQLPTKPPLPPILLYVLEFSLNSAEEKARFSRHIEVTGGESIGGRRVKVENLSPASDYVFRVRAINAAGAGPPSAHLLLRTANTPPSVSPANGRGAAFSSRAVLLSWSPIPAEQSYGTILGYHVIISSLDNSPGSSSTVLIPGAAAMRNHPHNGNGSVALVNELNCCETVIHGLEPYTRYEIRLRALNIAGLGPLSSPFSTTTAEEAPSSPPRASHPECLPLTSHSVQISWQSPPQSNGPINSYKVIFYPLDRNYISQAGVGEIHRTSGLTTVIGGLSPNTNYSFHITPVNIGGEGTGSLNVFCKTSEDVPSSPSNLIGFAASESSLYLSWLLPQNPNGILTHHTIYFRMIDKTSFEVKRSVPGNVDYHEESGLDLSRYKYIFWLTSSNRMGESGASSQITFNPPPIVETRLAGQSKSIVINEGNPLILPCRSLGRENASTAESSAVSWTFNGKKLSLDGNVYMKSGGNDLIFYGVRKSEQGNYTCQMKNSNNAKKASKKPISGMDAQKQLQLTYSLAVRGVACTPEPSYIVQERNVLIAWTFDERRSASFCDTPLGFILYYRFLGSILDWRKIIFHPSARNYTLKGITCGSILNMYMVAFNEVGVGGDSHLMSVVVSHAIPPFPQPHELLVPNITSILLNLYPLQVNHSYCPIDKFSIALREWQTKEWAPGRDVKIQIRNEYAIDGLKPSTRYEITITTFGYSTSRTASFTFTTLTQLGETPSTDVLNKNRVTSEHSHLYSNLTLILPSALAILALLAAVIAVSLYFKSRRLTPLVVGEGGRGYEHDGNYGYSHPLNRKSVGHEDQFYSGLPSCTPGLDDISPYATFQISDPKKFQEESFSQEIVVAKFHPVMHGLVPRGSRDKWMDRDPRQMQDSEDSESENTQRYSIIPVQRNAAPTRHCNLYQINPPSQPPPPLPYQSSEYQQPHHQDVLDGDDSSSSDTSRTIDRRSGKKEKKCSSRNKGGGRDTLNGRLHHIKDSGASWRHQKRKQASGASNYSIDV